MLGYLCFLHIKQISLYNLVTDMENPAKSNIDTLYCAFYQQWLFVLMPPLKSCIFIENGVRKNISFFPLI